MTLSTFLQFIIGAACANNVLLSRMLGFDSALETARDPKKAAVVGCAVACCMTVGAAIAWPLDRLLLQPMQAPYATTVMLVLVLVGGCMLVELLFPGFGARVQTASGAPFHLVAANCAILGIALVNTGVNPATGRPFLYVEAVVHAAASGIGFLAASVVLAAACERLERAPVPGSLRGTPVTLIAAGLLGLAVTGLRGFSAVP